MNRAHAMVVLAALCCIVSSVTADDLAPPSWRGEHGSTLQKWDFATDTNPTPPTSAINPFGEPSATIDFDGPYGSGWNDSLAEVYGSKQGWWDICRGAIVLSIANHPEMDAEVSKDIQVQVTYWSEMSEPPTVEVTPAATFVDKTTTWVETGPMGGDWRMDKWTFHVDANNDSEIVTIKGHPQMGSQIDQIVVDTRYCAEITSSAQARNLPDETVCVLTGPVATRSFGSYFYMEDVSRAAGVRINVASGHTSAAENTTPTVKGVFRVVDGERAIDQAVVVPGGNGSVFPLGMTGAALRTGLETQGLLVRLWGRADVATPQSSTFTLSDGSPEGVCVELHGVTAPSDNSYVVVSGVLGANADGPVLRVGLSDTIVTLSAP